MFSGIGGLDLSAEWAGFHTVGQVEIDDYCNKVLEKHWPNVPRWRDIFELKGEEIKEKCGSISLLSGGFPCQPFSCAGKRRGTEDERYLWDEMLRIICEVRPRWVVAENVRGLLSIDAGRTFGTVLSDLAENGYRVGWLCYGAGDVGAPHRRERVFILAHSGCELQQGAEFRRKDEVEIGRQVADKYQRSSKARGNDMAYSENARTGQNYRGLRPGVAGACGGEETGESGMADTNTKGLQGSELGRNNENKDSRGQESTTGTATKCNSNARAEGAVESTMGRVPSGFPAGMDGSNWPTPTGVERTSFGKGKPYITSSGSVRRKNNDGTTSNMGLEATVQNWPAGPGEQHEWEPPRIATGIKDRVARLKCLGNAVVPQQAYPIFKAIAEIEKAGE